MESHEVELPVITKSKLLPGNGSHGKARFVHLWTSRTFSRRELRRRILLWCSQMFGISLGILTFREPQFSLEQVTCRTQSQTSSFIHRVRVAVRRVHAKAYLYKQWRRLVADWRGIRLDLHGAVEPRLRLGLYRDTLRSPELMISWAGNDTGQAAILTDMRGAIKTR